LDVRAPDHHGRKDPARAVLPDVGTVLAFTRGDGSTHSNEENPMGVRSTLFKTLAYTRAPKTALILSSPVRGAAAILAAKALKKAAPPRLGTALGVLAASAALPAVVAWWQRRDLEGEPVVAD
jgi:hypothetical protein